MSLPELDDAGNFPEGVHEATLSEVLGRFGRSTAARRFVATRLRRIHEVAVATGHLARFVIYGSFAARQHSMASKPR